MFSNWSQMGIGSNTVQCLELRHLPEVSGVGSVFSQVKWWLKNREETLWIEMQEEYENAVNGLEAGRRRGATDERPLNECEGPYAGFFIIYSQEPFDAFYGTLSKVAF